MVKQVGDVTVDGEGVHFSIPFSGSADVYFGEHRGWSFAVDAPGKPLVPWPKRLHRFLEGWSEVRVVAGTDEMFRGRVSFTDADREVEMKDRHGLPIIVDKWGLLQRPFETRGEGLLGLLADESQRIIDVLEETCDVRSWISFGTLLGAARNGKGIGHDSDVDLCYLSEKKTPAEMQLELWRIGRALRAAGMRLTIRSGSFLTVLVDTPDGAGAGIDVYTTFFFDGNFYETATVRTPVPREALLPLKPIEFEGRMLPGPADPARILEISYGPNWRIPDPSFQHQPGREIEGRFDGWFGKFWRQRREWMNLNQTAARAGVQHSSFAESVLARVPAGARVIDVGAAAGADATFFASNDVQTVALDFGLSAPRFWKKDERLKREYLNLYDIRDVITRAAMLAQYDGHQVIYARDLLESVAPDGRQQFWQLASIALRRGGAIHLESKAWARAAIAVRADASRARFWPTGPDEARRAAEAIGGVVIDSEGVEEAERVLASSAVVPAATWRMTIQMAGRAGTPPGTQGANSA